MLWRGFTETAKRQNGSRQQAPQPGSIKAKRFSLQLRRGMCLMASTSTQRHCRTSSEGSCGISSIYQSAFRIFSGWWPWGLNGIDLIPKVVTESAIGVV